MNRASVRQLGPLRRAMRAGFTLLELLVVVAIILVIVAVTLPAVSRIVESANYAAAVNTVGAALGNARAAAMRTQRHTAVAFLYDLRNDRYELVTLEMASNSGSMTRLPSDIAVNPLAPYVMRPVIATTPVQLPKGTAVFGLSFAIEAEDSLIDDNTAHWYAGEFVQLDGNVTLIPWLFPHNDPLLYLPSTTLNAWDDEDGETALTDDPQRAEAVRHAQSFCVMFSPEGSVVDSATIGAGNNYANLFIDYPSEPHFREDARRTAFDDPLLFDPERVDPFDPTGQVGIYIQSVDQRFRTPNPEVLLRTVSQLAIVDLARLADATGFDEPWRVRASSALAMQGRITRFFTDTEVSELALVDRLDQNANPVDIETGDLAVRYMSRWIDRNAEIISFNRYTGEIVRR